MKQQKPFIFQFFHVIFWIIFIGLCIKAWALAYSFFVSANFNPVAAQNLYNGLNLSTLYDYDIVNYSAVVVAYIVLVIFQANMSYLVLKIFSDIDMATPFTEKINKTIKSMSYLWLLSGVFALLAHSYTKWVAKKADIIIPIEWAHEEILFFAIIVAFLALIFDKGIQLQKENDLTI